MTLCGMGAAMALKGYTTAKVFEAYVERFLVRELKTRQAVILDNLGAHNDE